MNAISPNATTAQRLIFVAVVFPKVDIAIVGWQHSIIKSNMLKHAASMSQLPEWRCCLSYRCRSPGRSPGRSVGRSVDPSIRPIQLWEFVFLFLESLTTFQNHLLYNNCCECSQAIIHPHLVDLAIPTRTHTATSPPNTPCQISIQKQKQQCD